MPDRSFRAKIFAQNLEAATTKDALMQLEVDQHQALARTRREIQQAQMNARSTGNFMAATDYARLIGRRDAIQHSIRQIQLKLTKLKEARHADAGS